jgi:magnesium-transporting ATPase (P-type)
MCDPPGDHALTGLAIGKMLGIAGNGSVVTGPELDEMTDDQLKLVSREHELHKSNVAMMS